MTPEMQKNIQDAIELAETVFRWTFIPALIVLGLNTGPEPRPSVLDLLPFGGPQ
eukprot:m.55721 g.55721  ORF g.55721 m.55721 type:complete len:54 (+) comp11143_c2_seq1:96-257(+)